MLVWMLIELESSARASIRERTEGSEGIKKNNINRPELPESKPRTKEYTWRNPWLKPYTEEGLV